MGSIYHRLQALERAQRRNTPGQTSQRQRLAVLTANPDEADRQAGCVRNILTRIAACEQGERQGSGAFAATVRSDPSARASFAEWNASRARLGMPPVAL